jgi:putative LysE/RhtB family amino acid efflux pump
MGASVDSCGSLGFFSCGAAVASELPFFGRGLLIGLAIAAPVGPMALLCIRRTLERGWPSGFASGLGIATADGTYAAVAAFGLTAVSGLLLRESRWVQLAGGAAIILLGLRSLVLAGPVADGDPSPSLREGPPRQAGRSELAGAYLSCLALTLANPPTILSFLAVMAGFGIGTSAGGTSAAAVVLGVLLGSAAWWAAVTGAVARARGRIGPGVRAWSTRLAGLLLMALGAAALVAAIRQ